MTKEEYKKNLIRLWDSLRTEHKGEKDCVGVGCRDCPLYNEVGICNVYKSIEIVENWAEENPVKTNADKFKEVFGIKDVEDMCVFRGRCEYCKYYIPDDNECGVQAKFWNAEYKEQTKE